jgi:flagellar biosynthesis chaperone FliJ
MNGARNTHSLRRNALTSIQIEQAFTRYATARRQRDIAEKLLMRHLEAGQFAVPIEYPKALQAEFLAYKELLLMLMMVLAEIESDVTTTERGYKEAENEIAQLQEQLDDYRATIQKLEIEVENSKLPRCGNCNSVTASPTDFCENCTPKRDRRGNPHSEIYH